MRFGRRRRTEAELHDLVRRELAATRAAVSEDVANAVASLERRARLEIERREQTTTALLGMLGRARAELATADTENVGSLELVATVCDRMLVHLEEERAARAELVDAIRRLAGPIAATGPGRIPRRGNQVIGGTIGAGASAPMHDTAPSPAGTDAVPAAIILDGVRVRCRFDGGGWIGGFEVAEVFTDNGRTQYQLRRSPGGYVLPRLFDECDVRHDADLASTSLHRGDE